MSGDLSVRHTYLRISFALAVAKLGCATKRWRKSVFRGCEWVEEKRTVL